MVEAVRDPRLVSDNPMFAQLATNPSGFAYPAAGAFATIPQAERIAAAPAPRNGEHSELVLSERLGLDSGAIARLVDAGIVGAG
jgi:2-methylfumaryl-CoA isomerase